MRIEKRKYTLADKCIMSTRIQVFKKIYKLLLKSYQLCIEEQISNRHCSATWKLIR